MIIRRNTSLLNLSRYVGRRLAFMFALDLIIAAAYVFADCTWLALPSIHLSIFGGVIGMIAGFRNTSAYARWWEARTIWGAVVNNSRSFARAVLSMVGADGADARTQRELNEMKHRLVMLQIAYVHALRNDLRRLPPWNELTGLIPEAEIDSLRTHHNVPLGIQQHMASLLAECYRRGWIDSMRWSGLDRTLSNLMDCQGGSERIKNTPMPRLYDHFIRFFITAYCLLLPFGMVQSLRLLTPFGSTFVGFAFLALDQIGRDLETPFENLPSDIPLTGITRGIEINLKQMLGESATPEPLAPVDGVLW